MKIVSLYVIDSEKRAVRLLLLVMKTFKLVTVTGIMWAPVCALYVAFRVSDFSYRSFCRATNLVFLTDVSIIFIFKLDHHKDRAKFFGYHTVVRIYSGMVRKPHFLTHSLYLL